MLNIYILEILIPLVIISAYEVYQIGESYIYLKDDIDRSLKDTLYSLVFVLSFYGTIRETYELLKETIETIDWVGIFIVGVVSLLVIIRIVLENKEEWKQIREKKEGNGKK